MSVSPDASTVCLSLVSHTNVGKTTLMRTLVRRDVGEVADRAHVTSNAEDQVLIETPQGDVLRLRDTPGFGDSVRLLKRLRMSHNPIGWFMTQVWDRLTDRAFFNSQIAIRSVRDQSDAVLYLVNAAEDPASAGYVDIELKILGWVGKPVLLLLNQMGAPPPHDVEAAEENAWRQHVTSHEVGGPVALDAFARCWVQEDRLLHAVGAMLSPHKQPAFERIRATWRTRNIKVFEESMAELAAQLAATATDRETGSAPGFALKIRRRLQSWMTRQPNVDPEVEQAMNTLAQRLGAAVSVTTNRLIALHGLSGRSERIILARLAGDSDVLKGSSNVGASSMLGGLLTGAAGGLAADLAAGGLTLGAGALIGGIIGALGAAGFTRAYELAHDADHIQVGWSREFLMQRVRAAMLRYLAVAHYGRGRGDWTSSEYPPHWQGLVEEVTLQRRQEFESVWLAAQGGASRDEVAKRLRPLITATAGDILVRMYPASKDIFEQRATQLLIADGS
jgi:hypothetical protein